MPVPPDSGKAEREHILRDSGAQAWLGETDDHCEGLPVVPVRLHARSWHSLSRTGTAVHSIRPVHVRNYRPTEGRSAQVARLSQPGSTRSPRPGTGRGETPSYTGLPLFHVHGLILGILGPLRIGSRVIHTVKPTPENYARAKGSLYFGVPTVWSRIAEDEEARPARCPVPDFWSPVVRRFPCLSSKNCGSEQD